MCRLYFPQESAGEHLHGVADEESTRLAKYMFQSVVSGCCSVDKLMAALRSTGRGRDRLLYAFVQWACTLPLWCLLLDAVHDTAAAVLRALSLERHAGAVLESDDVADPGWAVAYIDACAQGDGPAHTLVLCAMGRTLAAGGSNAGSWTTSLTRHIDAVYVCSLLTPQVRDTPHVCALPTHAPLDARGHRLIVPLYSRFPL